MHDLLSIISCLFTFLFIFTEFVYNIFCLHNFQSKNLNRNYFIQEFMMQLPILVPDTMNLSWSMFKSLELESFMEKKVQQFNQ